MAKCEWEWEWECRMTNDEWECRVPYLSWTCFLRSPQRPVAKKVGACHAEVFGVGGLDIGRYFSA